MRSVVQVYPGPPFLSVIGRVSLVVGFCERRTTKDERRNWGCSSAGRAPGLQPGGHRFDPGQLHQKPRRWPYVVVGFCERRTTKDERRTTNLMLGVNATTDSVSRFKKVAWRRTLGWRNFG